MRNKKTEGAIVRRYELKWEEKKGYAGSKTKEYDKIATSHITYVTTPIVTGYGIRSLLHQKHKFW